MTTTKEAYIVRRNPKTNFTILPNQLIEDTSISWKALGLLVYLLHLPPSFRLVLKNVVATRRKVNGMDSTRSGLKELQQSGYVTLVRERGPKGCYGRTFWYVSDAPDFTEIDA